MVDSLLGYLRPQRLAWLVFRDWVPVVRVVGWSAKDVFFRSLENISTRKVVVTPLKLCQASRFLEKDHDKTKQLGHNRVSSGMN